jgi:hypothetical protein
MQKEGWEMYFLQLESWPQIAQIGTEKKKLAKAAANPKIFVCENLCNLLAAGKSVAKNKMSRFAGHFGFQF